MVVNKGDVIGLSYILVLSNCIFIAVCYVGGDRLKKAPLSVTERGLIKGGVEKVPFGVYPSKG